MRIKNNTYKYFSKWTMLILCLLIFSNCQNEDFSEATSSTKDFVEISFSALESQVATRGTQDNSTENRVENLYLIVFDAHTKEKINSYYLDRSEASEDKSNPDIFASLANNFFRLFLARDAEVLVYGIANINNEIVDITEGQLERVNSLSDLQNINVSLKQNTIARGSSFVMSGMVEDEYGNPLIVSMAKNQTHAHRLNLSRLDSKVFFHINAGNNATFTPQEWHVESVAKRANLYREAEFFLQDALFFNTPSANFENNGQGFSFYSLENFQQPRQEISASDANGYFLRAKQDKNFKNHLGELTNGAYTYAPAHGTRVVFSGELKYKDNTTGASVTADVTYTVHLGYKDRDVNDYSLIRNNEYHYNITLNSATSIEVEVTTGHESEPGTEGHVTKGAQILQVDAHYSTHTLTFNKSDLHNITWYIQTPFSKGYESDFKGKAVDTDWVRFRTNLKRSGYDPNHNIYRYFYTKEFMGFSSEVFPDNYNYKYYVDGEHFEYLMTLDQLMVLLRKALYDPTRCFDGRDQIVVTVFVNENYYDKNPITGQKDPELWKKVVNKPDRVLSITSGKQVSQDGESSLVNSVVTIKQHAIQTIYDPNSPGLQSAWGTESIRETELLQFSIKHLYRDNHDEYIPTSYMSRSNGRKNQLNILEEARKDVYDHTFGWNDVMNVRYNSIKNEYNAIKFACLQRNRDENNNAIIDNEEVKWYLASINQLTDLWIGENSLSEKAKLYKLISGKEDEWYLSSTNGQSQIEGTNKGTYWDNPWVLWAKEGSSLGVMGGVPNATNRTKFNYRCVRNLGLSNHTKEEEPQDYVEVSTDYYPKLTVKHLDRKSIRSYTQQAELPKHHERSADNKPWRSFEMNPDVFKEENMSWYKVQEDIQKGKSPCPKGYRVPNQREAAIMVSRLPNYKFQGPERYYFTNTSYSFSPSYYPEQGFAIEYINWERVQQCLIGHESIKGAVRCVRDI